MKRRIISFLLAAAITVLLYYFASTAGQTGEPEADKREADLKEIRETEAWLLEDEKMDGWPIVNDSKELLRIRRPWLQFNGTAVIMVTEQEMKTILEAFPDELQNPEGRAIILYTDKIIFTAGESE